MNNGNHSVNRRHLLRTVGTGLAVGSLGAMSGCLGQADADEGSEITPAEESGAVEETDDEPSSDSSLAGSASGEPSGIERHNMSFRGRYNANHYRPYHNYKTDFTYIYNGGGYVLTIEAFPGDVDADEPTYIREISLGSWVGFPRFGDIRVNVVGSSESLVIKPEVKNVEIWMAGATQTAYYWVGDF